MNAMLTGVLLGVVLTVAIVAAVWLAMLGLRRRSGGNVAIHSNIQLVRSIGQLSVFKVVTKEIVTETDHSWGEFGARYLSWVLSAKKMAMIFEFEIDFRYDLHRADFDIINTGDHAYLIRMPPCFFEAHIRDIRFYDEQKSQFLPWLLPDLLNGFLPLGFSEADKNRLVAAAKSHAEKQAVELISNLQSEVQNSAAATLRAISRAFGAQNVTFEFLPQGEIRLEVGVAGAVGA